MLLTPEIDVKDYRVYQPPYVMGRVDRPFNDYVRNLCLELKESKDREDSRHKLAGNLEHEYFLSKDLENAVRPVVQAAFLDRFNANQVEFGFPTIDEVIWLTTWANYQRKYEFNPTHTHTGKYSFVWWVQIPFNLQDEMDLPWVKESNTPCASLFQWEYHVLNATQSQQATIPIDKGDEGTFFIFPANTPHQVYPFYTSDDLRISISGNFNFEFNT